MNLEQIDTSTTAGKIRVMELAEQGRNVAAARRGGQKVFGHVSRPNWNWEVCDFAIIAALTPPEGYVAAPEDPSLAMTAAGKLFGLTANQACAVYQSMLAARPEMP